MDGLLSTGHLPNIGTSLMPVKSIGLSKTLFFLPCVVCIRVNKSQLNSFIIPQNVKFISQFAKIKHPNKKNNCSIQKAKKSK